MRPGVVIWVLGSPDKLEEIGKAIKAAVRDFFDFSVIVLEDEVNEHLCGNEQEGADVCKLAVERTGWLCRFIERNGGAGIALSHASKREERDATRKKAAGMIEVLVAGALPKELEPPFYPEVEVAEGDGAEVIKSKIVEALKSIGILDEASRKYDEKEEQLVKERLEKLGYL